MRPNSVEILKGIQYSFDKYVLPELEHPLAVSAAKGIQVLLHHLELRVEAEAPLLDEDNKEKKMLFMTLARLLKRPMTGKSYSEALKDLADKLERAAVKQFRDPGVFPEISLLSSENAEHKEVLDQVIRDLHQCREDLEAEAYAEIKQHLRLHLAGQLERETRLLAEALSRPLF